jgi:hypothetical protein
MSDAERQVECGDHGHTAATFMCRHLKRGLGCGFHDAGTEGDAWPDAWCDRCQAAFERDGEWTEDNEPELALLCTHCYERARERNRRLIVPLRPGQLSVSDEELTALIDAAHRWCAAQQERALAQWSFDRYARWSYEGELGTLRFYDREAGPALVADAEVAGSFSTRTNTWMWAWGNEQNEASDRARTEGVQVFGEVRGIAKLAEAHWPAEEVDAWEVTQLAAYLLGADAIYRAPMGHLQVFLLLRNFRVEPGDAS